MRSTRLLPAKAAAVADMFLGLLMPHCGLAARKDDAAQQGVVRLAERDLWNVQSADHSALMPANLVTLPHFSVSSAMSFPMSAGKPASSSAPVVAGPRSSATKIDP
jgi:hypothetical protein